MEFQELLEPIQMVFMKEQFEVIEFQELLEPIVPMGFLVQQGFVLDFEFEIGLIEH